MSQLPTPLKGSVFCLKMNKKTPFYLRCTKERSFFMDHLVCASCLEASPTTEEKEVYCVYCGDSVMIHHSNDFHCCAYCSQIYRICMCCGKPFEKTKKDSN